MVYNQVMETVTLRDERGRFLEGTKPINTIKSSADARMMAQKRWNKAAQKARDRITREAASIDPTITNVYDAHALMLTKQYTTILDSDKPRMDDAEKLSQMLGLAPRNVELREPTLPQIQAGDVDAVLMLVLRRRLESDAIDGEVVEDGKV